MANAAGSSPSAPRAAAPLEAWSQVCIIGLGLIGGCLARALRQRLPRLRLVGIEREQSARNPLLATLVDEVCSDQQHERVEQALRSSELICVATPVATISGWVERALAHGNVVTDCGSSKRAIVTAAQASGHAARFVAGHPMAGAGADRTALSPQLFEGRPWVLCPEQCAPEALAAVERLVTLVGARPVQMSAATHDRAVAMTSHAPRLVASVLMALAEQQQALPAAGPAFERITRGAGGSLEMWRDVLDSNADEIARALRLLIRELEQCASELEQGRVDHNLATLAAAEKAREVFDAGRRPPG